MQYKQNENQGKKEEEIQDTYYAWLVIAMHLAAFIFKLYTLEIFQFIERCIHV